VSQAIENMGDANWMHCVGVYDDREHDRTEESRGSEGISL
jgi:hypothetical protein